MRRDEVNDLLRILIPAAAVAVAAFLMVQALSKARQEERSKKATQEDVRDARERALRNDVRELERRVRELERRGSPAEDPGAGK